MFASTANGELEPVDVVAAQHAAGKESLRPLYDRLVALAASLHNTAEVSWKETSMSRRRSKQLAALTPATRTRIRTHSRETRPRSLHPCAKDHEGYGGPE